MLRAQRLGHCRQRLAYVHWYTYTRVKEYKSRDHVCVDAGLSETEDCS